MKNSAMEAPAISMPQVLSQPGGSNKEQAADYNKFHLSRHQVTLQPSSSPMQRHF